MASYYNKTRGPIALSLTGGHSVSLGPKRSIILEGADEFCESVLRSCVKGYLVKLGVVVQTTFPVVPVLPAPEPALPVVQEEPAAVVIPDPVPVDPTPVIDESTIELTPDPVPA
jgi:hypothetical protein